MSKKDKADDASVQAGDGFIKSILEAVGPVIPILMRTKSLDGGNLLTALYLLEAAEFLFTQYERNVRIKANRAGLIGMCSALRSGFERSVFCQKDLQNFSEFI